MSSATSATLHGRLARSSRKRQASQTRRDVAILLVLFVVLFLRFPLKHWRGHPFLMDYEVYRATAVRVVTGDGAQVYAPTTSDKALFKYAPVWAILLVPLAGMSDHAGAVAWTALSVICFVATFWVGARLCRRMGLSVEMATAWLVTGLLWRLLMEEFLNGQANAVLGVLLVAALAGFAFRHHWQGALYLALAISLKLPALLLFVYLGLRRAWGAMARTIILFLLINGVAAILLQPHDPLGVFRAWIHVLRMSAPDRAFEIGAQSLLALLGRFLTADGYGLNVLALSRSAVIWCTLAIQCVVLVGLSLSPEARVRRLQWAIDGALIITMAALFSPTCWLATYTGLAFPLFVIFALLTTSPYAFLRDRWSVGLLASVGIFSVFLQKRAWWALGIRRIAQEEYTYLVAMIAPWMALMVLLLLFRQRISGTPILTASSRRRS